jgi:hypothetical protein
MCQASDAQGQQQTHEYFVHQLIQFTAKRKSL